MTVHDTMSEGLVRRLAAGQYYGRSPGTGRRLPLLEQSFKIAQEAAGIRLELSLSVEPAEDAEQVDRPGSGEALATHDHGAAG